MQLMVVSRGGGVLIVMHGRSRMTMDALGFATKAEGPTSDVPNLELSGLSSGRATCGFLFENHCVGSLL